MLRTGRRSLPPKGFHRPLLSFGAPNFSVLPRKSIFPMYSTTKTQNVNRKTLPSRRSGSLPCVKGGGICEANDGGIVRCAKAHLRFLAPPFFSFSFRRKKRTAAASEEACSIPLPRGRRKLHIRSLLLPSRKPTAALGRLSVPIRKGKRRPENLSDGSLDSPSTKGLALGARGV